MWCQEGCQSEWTVCHYFPPKYKKLNKSALVQLLHVKKFSVPPAVRKQKSKFPLHKDAIINWSDT